MKQHMKKVLALILCTLMIVTAALPVLAADAELTAQSEGTGKLAITEVAPNPDGGESFEYIEVMNTGDAAVDLNDYYVYRYMFSHSGNSAQSGLKQIMGISTCSNTTAFALDCGTKTLNADDIALVWFQTNAEDTVDGFVEYWNGLYTDDEDISDADVAVVDATSYLVETVSTAYGKGFLSDSKCGYAVSFVKASFAETDVQDLDMGTKGNDTSETAAKTKARHDNADAITVIYATSAQPGKVAHRYGYLDRASFKAAREAANQIENEKYALADKYLYSALMMPRPATDGSVDVTLIRNTYFKFDVSTTWQGKDDTYFLNVTAWESATPGTLVTGQFGNGTIAPTSDIKGTGLAMTEVCVGTEAWSSEGSKNLDNEFIEVKNTTSSDILLTDYRVVLMGMTNSGVYENFVYGSFISDGSTNGGCVRKTEKSYATIESVWQLGDETKKIENNTLGKGETAVIWFNNGTVDKAALDSFKAHWEQEGKGNDMDGVIVAVASYTVGSSFAARGNGFLPDSSVEYSLSLINQNTATADVQFADAWANLEQTSASMTPAYVQFFAYNADSVTYIMAKGGAEKNMSCNYFGYIDKAKYTQDAQAFSQGLLAINGTTVPLVGADGILDAPVNTVVMKGQPLYQYMLTTKGFSAGENYYLYVKKGDVNPLTGETVTSNTYNNEYKADKFNSVFVKTAFDSVPTPGALLDGQFGYDASVSDIIDVEGFQTAKATDFYHIASGNYDKTASNSPSKNTTGYAIPHYYIEEGTEHTLVYNITVAEAGVYDMVIHLRFKDDKERGNKFTVNPGTNGEYTFSTSFQPTAEQVDATKSTDGLDSAYMYGMQIYLNEGKNVIKIEDAGCAKCQHYRDFYFCLAEADVSGCKHTFTDNVCTACEAKAFTSAVADNYGLEEPLALESKFDGDKSGVVDTFYFSSTLIEKFTATNGNSDVRIIGKLNLTSAELGNYSAIGIEVAGAQEATDAKTMYRSGTSSTGYTYDKISNAVCTKQIEITTGTVYKSLTDNNGTDYSNADGYMFAITLSDIPDLNCNLTFRCYVVDNNGEKIYTGMYQITDTSN